MGFSRTEYSEDQFRELMWQGVRELGELDVRRDEWEAFAEDLHYVSGDLGDLEHLHRLGQRLDELEAEAQPVNRLFYLSIAPHLYETAINPDKTQSVREWGQSCCLR